MPENNKKTFERIFTKARIYLTVIAIVLILLCVQNVHFIIPSITLYVILIAYTMWTNNKNKSELDRHIQELTFSVDTMAKNTLINSPFPLVIVEQDGTIIWKSVSYINEFGNIDIKTVLEEVIKSAKAKIDNQENKKDAIYEQIKVGKKDYKVIIEPLEVKSKNRRKRNENLLGVYIIDNTEMLSALQKYEDAQMCIRNYYD